MIRILTCEIKDVLPFIFTKEMRKSLQKRGFSYKSKEWKEASIHKYKVLINGELVDIKVSMGSHRYQLFAMLDGTKCKYCGFQGTYFALERGEKDNPKKFHFNLYGRDASGKEVMLTKDHIIPRSKGGRNRLSNYQTLCADCNRIKSDR